MRTSFLSDAFEKAMFKSMAPTRLNRTNTRRPKRFRSTYTTEQTNYLETQFKKFPYITREHRKEVAAFLKMDERPVKIWFQNRRMREKKDKECGSSGDTRNNGPQEFKDQLFVHDEPSANDLRSYSLLTMSSTFDATDKFNTDCDIPKILNNAEQPKVPLKTDYKNQTISQAKMYHKETNNADSFRFYHQSLPSTSEPKKKTSSQNKLEQPPRVSKKCKNETTKLNNIAFDKELKVSRSRENSSYCYKHSEGNNFGDKKSKLAQKVAPLPKKIPKEYFMSRPDKHNVRNPMYCPAVIPAVYSPQFVPSDVIWRHVNIMPIVAAPTAKSQEIREQNDRCCKCKCHENILNLPATISQNLQKPCAQYVISVPFHNPTSKM